MTADLPTIVRDYLKERFPDKKVGVTVGNWVYVLDSSQYDCMYIALVMDTYVRPFWHPNPPLEHVAQKDIEAADPKFFEVIEKLVGIYLKEKPNG